MSDNFTCISDAIEGESTLEFLGEEVGKVAPEGSEVLFLYDEREKCQTVRDVVGRFCKIDSVKISDCTLVKCQKIIPSEQCRAVVGAGGRECVNVAKYVCTKYSLPLIFVALEQSCHDYLTGASTLFFNGYPEIYSVKPPVKVIADATLLEGGDENARGYGATCARLVTLFDEDVKRAMGESVDNQTYAYLLAEICDLIECEKNGLTARRVMQSALRVSYALEKMRAYTDGCRQSAQVLGLLKNRANEKSKTQAENESILAPFVMACYLLSICVDNGTGVYVPDNNAQIDIMYRLLGVSPLTAIKVVNKHESLNGILQKIHCLKVYKSELIRRGEIYRKVLEFAQNRVKRLYKDRGFSYNKYLDGRTVKRCFALAPEMRGKQTLFSLMKQTGIAKAFLSK